jgi:hypothetical protein
MMVTSLGTPAEHFVDRPQRRKIVLASVAAVLAFFLVCEHFDLDDYVIPRNFGTVVDGRIYRSGRLTTRTLRGVIREHGIRTIVDLGTYRRGSKPARAMREIAEQMGVDRYSMYLLGDGRGNPNAFVDALRIMSDPERQPVLVQCAAGAHRTGAAVLLYRHVVEGVPIQLAYEESFEHGHEEDDWEMLAYVADWVDEIAEAYRSGEPIPDVEPVRPQPGGPALDALRPSLPEAPPRPQGRRARPDS